MKDQLLPFNTGALLFIAIYLLSLIGIGWLSYRQRGENNLKDFYLGGGNMGFLVIMLTLYATQYSGNTLLGFTGKTYRIGFSWLMSVHFMTAIIVFYLIYAPKLYALSKRHEFITPCDYLDYRFSSRAISLIGVLIMVLGLSNFLLAQLIAMGRVAEGLVGGDPDTAFIAGVIFLAVIIVVYESLGGLRAVAWTDVIQGGVLMVGFLILVVMVIDKFGSMQQTTSLLVQMENGVKKVEAPSGNALRQWWSYIILVGMGGALYPQAIQRIYAAKNAKILRKSLTVMAFLPFSTALIAVIVGIYAAAHLPGLEGAGSDAVLARIMREIQADSAFGYGLVVLLFAAILAAVMSTADSALLTISSMLTRDVYAKQINPQASEEQQTRLGKKLSWLLIAVLVFVAIMLRKDTTLVKLLDKKFDLLLQLVPSFFIAIHVMRLQAKAILGGIVAGLALTLYLHFTGNGKPWGFHAGIYGLILNLSVVGVLSLFQGEKKSDA